MKSLTLLSVLLALVICSSAEDEVPTKPPPIATELPNPVPPKPSKPVFDFEKACCLLEWTKLIDLKDGTKALPSTAILFGERNDQIKIFMAIRSDNWLGVVTDHLYEGITYRLEDDLIFKKFYDDVYVLSNPNNCDIGWYNRKKGQYVQDTMQRYFPAINGQLIARINDDKDVIEKIGVLKPTGIAHAPQDLYGLSVGPHQIIDIKDPENAQVLYVNCVTKFKEHQKIPI